MKSIHKLKAIFGANLEVGHICDTENREKVCYYGLKQKRTKPIETETVI